MKKLSLKKLNLGANELLKREQLKTVLGGMEVKDVMGPMRLALKAKFAADLLEAHIIARDALVENFVNSYKNYGL